MKNAMQLKAIIKNISKIKNISSQIVLQNYMLERLLERISVSNYKYYFILKGGFLISAIVGLDTRSTMDMDATIRDLVVNQNTIIKMFDEICCIPLDDNISFFVKRIEDIHESNEYSGLRVVIEAKYQQLTVPLKIDITVGDQITPHEIEFEFKLLLEPRSIKIFAYNLETVMAEKLETVISRSDQNTRFRDYYDIFILHKLQWQNIEIDTLRLALVATATKRNSFSIMERYNNILHSVSISKVMNKRWLDYQSDFNYATNILFSDICIIIKEILDSLFA
jgi:predicted nucleotidyltransferase component of viral defense system